MLDDVNIRALTEMENFHWLKGKTQYSREPKTTSFEPGSFILIRNKHKQKDNRYHRRAVAPK